MTKRARNIDNLLSLLDDEDERVAVSAMAELLYRERELGTRLAELQDCDQPLVRRRVHQLQAAITLRRRRREFAAKLKSRKVALPEGLIDVHLQWFDNDSRPGLDKLLFDFHAESMRCCVDSLDELSYFMQKNGFRAYSETTMHAEYYCIGPVIENRVGTVSMLAAAAALAAPTSAPVSVVRAMGDFALRDDRRHMLLLPGRDWMVVEEPHSPRAELWTTPRLLTYFSANLFSSAVNSDSFRYILTIAQSLTGAEDDSPLDAMPYPYYPSEEEEDGEKSDQPLQKK